MRVKQNHSNFREMLAGGHPNSLGKTIEVVDIILADNSRLEELFNCYFSPDEVVRLRTSNAMKRICKVQREWLIPYIDKLLSEVSQIEQASAQWTLAQLFNQLGEFLSPKQRKQAKKVLKTNLDAYSDWIVLNSTMDTLAKWSKSDPELKDWLKPYLAEISLDKRKSVSNRATKIIKQLNY